MWCSTNIYMFDAPHKNIFFYETHTHKCDVLHIYNWLMFHIHGNVKQKCLKHEDEITVLYN